MNSKYPFSHDLPVGEEETQQDHDGHDGHESGRRHAAKGHAAYASREKELPLSAMRGAGFGSIGGLYADDAAASAELGAQAHEAGNVLAEVAREELLAECVIRICPDCQVKKEADDMRLRSLAELDNARKRLSRERDEQVRFAAEAVLTDIIPSLDNLDLALQHAGAKEPCKDFMTGVQMTRKLLFEALRKHGLEPAGELGEAFDPSIHEAVGMADEPEVPAGHVCALVSKGYKLKDRLLRPARVVVCKKGQ